MTEMHTRERGLALGVILILIAAGLLTAAMVFGLQSGPPQKGFGTILGGLYFQYLGLLFLLSYFFPTRTFLFRGMMWVCEHFSRQPGRWNALVYFGLGTVFGGVVILYGIGLIK